uniref:Uncharacterized protein n=1 Tax=Methylophaga nitratireducenticrescens TaxID=754476 RepID=I1XJ84_METNJ
MYLTPLGSRSKTFISIDGVVAPMRPAPATLVHPCTSYAKANVWNMRAPAFL